MTIQSITEREFFCRYEGECKQASGWIQSRREKTVGRLNMASRRDLVMRIERGGRMREEEKDDQERASENSSYKGMRS